MGRGNALFWYKNISNEVFRSTSNDIKLYIKLITKYYVDFIAKIIETFFFVAI